MKIELSKVKQDVIEIYFEGGQYLLINPLANNNVLLVTGKNKKAADNATLTDGKLHH